MSNPKPNYLDAELVEDLVAQLAEARKVPAKRRALRTAAQGAVFAGLMAGGQVAYSAMGGHLDAKAVALAAAQAFGTAVLSYLHRDKAA